MNHDLSLDVRRRYYRALIERDAAFDGVVYYGIRTTGIFCRSVCPARKPLLENCEFFSQLQQALLAGYRPCKKCRPPEFPNSLDVPLQRLLEQIELDPGRRWRDADLRSIGLDPSTVRRRFQKRFGMTFIAYTRARRMGIAMETIRCNRRVIDGQMATGYESASGFRDAFARIMGTTPRKGPELVLFATWIDTPLGPMIALADSSSLRLLEFIDRRGLEAEIEKLRKQLNAAIVPGDQVVLQQIRMELQNYFDGKSKEFRCPIALSGTPFQLRVWEELRTIPIGTTRSYAEQAARLGQPTAVRAVARANGANSLAIIVPCHRVVGSQGELTGYAGGLARKRWLLDHESKILLASPYEQDARRVD